MKRKFLSLVLASAMSVTMLAGCGNKANDGGWQKAYFGYLLPAHQWIWNYSVLDVSHYCLAQNYTLRLLFRFSFLHPD